MTLPTTDAPIALAVRGVHLMATGGRAEFEEVYGPTAVDRDNAVQPAGSRVPGPAGFWATALWLRGAVHDLHYEIHHAIAHDDLVAVHASMLGHQTGEWVFYTEDGGVDSVFPATGRSFVMTESHWFRVEGGRIAEHWANHDALGTARQLGWVPPTPAYFGRMAMAKGRAVARLRASRE
jgi:predicted ester cyclase